MARAKKLPSGKYRCLAFSHTEKVFDPKTGKTKDKRVYVSFTREKRKDAELAAARFQAERTPAALKKRQEYGDITLTEAIDLYIGSRELLGRSPHHDPGLPMHPEERLPGPHADKAQGYG